MKKPTLKIALFLCVMMIGSGILFDLHCVFTAWALGIIAIMGFFMLPMLTEMIMEEDK